MTKTNCSCLCASPPKKPSQCVPMNCQQITQCIQNLNQNLNQDQSPNVYHHDLDVLNITKLLKKVGALFRGVHYRYREGEPCVTYRVSYTVISADGLQVPTDTKVRLPFSPDQIQAKYSFTPLVEYVRLYKLLSATSKDNIAYQEVFNQFLQKYYAAVDFLITFPVQITGKYLYCIDLYGGLDKAGYIRLATLLTNIRKHLLTNDGVVRGLISEYNEVQATGVLAVNSALDYTINKNSVVYNKLSVPQSRLYIV